MESEATELQDSLKIAKRYGRVLGASPSTFVGAIRSLINEAGQDQKVMGSATAFQINRLMKGQTLLACLYFGAKTFYPNKFKESPPKSGVLDIARYYDPFGLAAVLGLVYLYKRVKRICNPEDWKHLSESFQRSVELGGQLGLRVPSIGFGYGILGAAIHYIGFGSFLSHDQKGFREYRRHLKMKSLWFDPQYETARWGCTSVEVGSAIMIGMGFGVPISNAYLCAMSPFKSFPGRLEGEARRFLQVRLWLEAFHRKGSRPDDKDLVVSVPDAAILNQILRFADELMSEGSKIQFLEKGRDHISMAATPELFIDSNSSAQGDEPPVIRSRYSDLPDAVRDVVSEADFEQFKHLTVDEIVLLVTQ